MPTNTQNYNLVKPGDDEYYDIEVHNGNMDIIDAELKKVNDKADSGISSLKKDNLFQAAGGTATAITLTISETLVNGFPITFIASANNNGVATTINSKPLYKPNTIVAPILTSGKAYTVWYSSTGNCFFIKANEGGDCKFSNIIKFGNFNSPTAVELWTGNASVNNFVANKMQNVGTGGWHAPNTHYSFKLATYVNQKVYVRVTLKALDTGCLSLSIYTTDGDNNQVVAATRYSEIVQNQEYVLSGISTQVANTSNLNFFVRHGYVDTAAAIGKTLEISNVMVSDLTERYGAGKEPSAEECDALVEQFGGWWDSDLKVLTANATATSDKILATYTTYTNGQLEVGTIQSLSTQTYTPTTTDQTIASGKYLSGAQTIKGDTKLVAANIKDGVNIFGVTGTYAPTSLLAGDIALYEDSNLRSTKAINLIKVREIQILRAGAMRISFSLSIESSSSIANGQIYVNGIARGVLRTVTGTQYIIFTEDVSVNIGDYVQLYIKTADNLYSSRNNYFKIGISNSNNIVIVM